MFKEHCELPGYANAVSVQYKMQAAYASLK